ncbi:MAG: hypothetical protein HUK18_06465 [Bacteroidales bacterium]|nr:hypothetical protein [Bacteroidales bacterium]
MQKKKKSFIIDIITKIKKLIKKSTIMTKKEKIFKNWKIEIDEKDSVAVYLNGEECTPTKEELKKIGKELGCELDSSMTTHEMGRFVVNALEMKETKTIKFDGRTSVAQLKRYFKVVYNVSLRVYDDGKIADDSKHLSEISACGAKSNGSLECPDSITIGELIKLIKEQFGLEVKIATQDNWVIVLDDITLATAGTIKKQAVRADMEALLASKSEKEDASTQCSETEYLNVGMTGVYIETLRLTENEVMDYLKTGNLEEIKKRVKNCIYETNTLKDTSFTLWKREGNPFKVGGIYTDNKYIVDRYDEDEEAYDTFVFPCPFIVVVGGKVVATFTIDEEPDKEEGCLLFTQIPYDYDYDDKRWEEENLEEDSEWLEEDMLSLISRTEDDDDWTRYAYKIGQFCDGLYAKKNDDDMWDFAVVANNKVVFSIGDSMLDFEEDEDLEK